MALRVFVSSTSEDLKEKYRVSAISIIDSFEPKAIAEAMEKWNEDHIDPVPVCRRKVENSSHYVGIFAYRRGWVPDKPELKARSITEVEYDWSRELSQVQYILIPEPGSQASIELRIKATDQKKSESEAQNEFLRRVRNTGIVRFFRSYAEFEERVRSKVDEWVERDGKTLLQYVSNSTKEEGNVDQTSSSDSKISFPKSETQYISPFQIGRLKHILCFQNADKITRRKASYIANCYLLYGSEGMGHKEIIRELISDLEPSCQIFPLHCLSIWNDVDANNLFKQIWQSTCTDDSKYTFTNMIQGIQKRLQFHDIILQVDHLEEFSDSLGDFIEQFWLPIKNALHVETKYRLIIFSILRRSNVDEISERIHYLAEESFSYFDNKKLISLPELTSLKIKDIQNWLEENYPQMASDKISMKANELFDKCNGNPEKLYRILNSMKK